MNRNYRVLLAGLAWGIGAHQLLRDGWGLSVPIAAVLLFAAVLAAGAGGDAAARRRLATVACVVVAAATVFAVRESWFARATALGAGFTALAWLAVRGPDSTLTQLTGAAHLASRLLVGTPLVAREAPSIELNRLPTAARQVGRGLVLALPIALLFLMLFAAADPVLASRMDAIFRFDAAGALETGVGSMLWAWLGTGVLAAVWRPALPPSRAFPHAGRVETLTVATVLTALFATGVAFQLRYLFGGDAYLLEFAGLTRAEYARRGFFELLAIAVLAMPTIVWLRRPAGNGKSEPALTGLLLALVAMLGLVLVSAAHRLLRYHEAFGMSEPRMYGGTVELWLAGALVWLGLLVAMGRVERFLPPVAVWGVALVLATAAVNPAGLVQRVNIARATRGGTFDARHAVLDLGADGRPVLIAGLDRLPLAVRCEAVQLLGAEGALPRRGGLDWTWSRARAGAAMPSPAEWALWERQCAAAADVR